VPEPSGLFASKDDDPSRPFGEPFKHWSPPPLSESLATGFRLTDA
jgi:hypothetical protein